MVFGSKNPEKYEQRALVAEQRGKTKKAMKNREKAATIRTKMGHPQTHGLPLGTGVPLSTGAYPVGGAYPLGGTSTTTTTTTRNFGFYENKAVKWEQRNNYSKAQKNREKAWRYNNPQYANSMAPQFYQSNRFLGYNIPFDQTNNRGMMMNNGGMANYSAMNTGMAMNNGMAMNTGMVMNTGMATRSVTTPVTVETHVRPTIVEQTVRQERITEVQPIIHREIDAPHIKVIEQHMYETVRSQGPHTITNQAIVEETVRPRVIEEIQPVIHRNVAQTFVERVEQHSTERVVAPTTTTKEVIQDRSIHVAAGGPVAVGGLVGGVHGQQTTQTTTTTGPGFSNTQTSSSGPLGAHAHTGLAGFNDTTLSGQHNAAHVSQVNQARRL